jgi:hypothetical protein
VESCEPKSASGSVSVEWQKGQMAASPSDVSRDAEEGAE